jgi:hypothetical protein
MNKHVGIREHGVAKVYVEEPGKGRVLLNPRFKLRNHSPSGFKWGYAGSGPSQTGARAHGGCARRRHALDPYMDYKFSVIARLPQEKSWTLTQTEVLNGIHSILKVRPLRLR